MIRVSTRALRWLGSGIALAFLAAVVGLPYGRLNHTAYAGLYHNGGTTPALDGHFAIDCNPGGAVDEICATTGGTHRVDVVFEHNSTASTIAFVEFRIRNTEPGVIDAIADNAPHSGNPDFNEAALPGTWECSLFAPSPEDDTGALVGDEEHRLACGVSAGLGPSYAIGTPIVVAHIDYTVGAAGASTLSFTGGLVGDNEGAEYGVECAGTDGIPENDDDPCFGATIINGFLDSDGDSAADYDDNCPYLSNPGQENNDRNFIDLPPTEAFDDVTLANSDAQGDACDPDDDNDGLTDAAEISGAPCASATAATLALVADTDGDLTLDGAECAIGTNPNSASSKPTQAQCGSTMDTDGDGVLNFREVCYYNTSPSHPNTDGDGCKDGREVASINADLTVNVVDLQQVAQSSGPSTDPDYVVDFDVHKNGSIDVIDLLFVAMRSGPCP